MSVILSGIQPSSPKLHLGNYIGSLLNWKDMVKSMNDEDKCYFMIADLHSLTSNKNRNAMLENTKNLIATYIACGIQPSENVIFFKQSMIPAHCELCWILSTITPLGQLERMTQFKDKKGKLSVNDINSGLLYYPVLMVADIILYKANLVPVGEDQKQHLELTRDIVDKFINIYGNGDNDDIFVKPNPMIDNVSKRIMSLGDGSKKMSKSVGEEKDKIFLTDTNEEIAKKIKTAKTDSITGIYYDKENRLEVSNLINIYSAISKKTVEEISNEYRDKSTKIFKDDLTEIVVNEISPIRERQVEILKDVDYLYKILENGNKIANEVANETLIKVKKAVGLL